MNIHLFNNIKNKISFRLLSRLIGILSLIAANFSFAAKNSENQIPHFVTQDGRHAFIVDGAPFLMLGIQAHNSSNYPGALKYIWPSFEKMHANTLEIPVAWEQVEPEENKFDFSYVDVLVKEARQHNARLVLLWFGAWKNSGPHYTPAWVKLNNKRFPRVVSKTGEQVDSFSPNYSETLKADKKAFVEFIKHIKKIDEVHTVIIIQVENEVGTWGGTDRDYSPAAEKLFQQGIPQELAEKLSHASNVNYKGKSWAEAFGKEADEQFHAYSIARYVDQLAEAGKAIKNLPMYINVAVRDPFNPSGWEKGGATDNTIPVWKAAAPHIDGLEPDIYDQDHKKVVKWIEQYSRADNPFFIPEIGNHPNYAKYFFDALGAGAVGFAPFGMDDSDYYNAPLGADKFDDEVIKPFADLYALVAPMMREWAAISAVHKTWGVSEPLTSDEVKKMQAPADASKSDKEIATKKIAAALTQTLDLGRWNLDVTYNRPMFFTFPPSGNKLADGGALIAQLSENEYLVTAYKARLEFKTSDEISGKHFTFDRVEEGHFEKGQWVMERVWNGDQTDWGLNFRERPHLLKVRLATY